MISELLKESYMHRNLGRITFLKFALIMKILNLIVFVSIMKGYKFDFLNFLSDRAKKDQVLGLILRL